MPSDAFLALQTLLETRPAALAAARHLGAEAEVGVELDGDEQARYRLVDGRPRLLPEPAASPDFTLRIPEPAVRQLTALVGDDVGAYGVAFFSLVVAREADRRIRVRIHAPASRLLGRGWLAVLASGGAKVTWWLLRKGIRNPMAAIDRLRAGR